MKKTLLFNKPFGVLCQFTDQEGRSTLADYVDVPGVYAAGRLDRDSEGLLVLTNDGALQARISDPKFKRPKTYLVQVDGAVNEQAVRLLEAGVQLKDGLAQAKSANITEEPDWLWPRNPPIRVRKNLPTSWIEVTLTEGRNRQVRRMTAKAGFPTLRLIRTAIADWSIDEIPPGHFRQID